MSAPTLYVLYPHPKDLAAFEAAYTDHIALADRLLGFAPEARPYTITRFAPNPDGSKAAYFQMFSLPFASVEELQGAMSTPAFQEVAQDAQRIATGGDLVILVGSAL